MTKPQRPRAHLSSRSVYLGAGYLGATRLGSTPLAIALSLASLSVTSLERASASPRTERVRIEPSEVELGPEASPKPSTAQRSLASVVALTPGVVIAGGGHWMIGQEDTAEALFWAKLGGLVGIFAGGAAVATSGASELVTPWAIPALVVSGAAFVIPTALDLVGVWSDPKAPRTPSAPRLGAPLLYGRGQFIVGAQSAATMIGWAGR